MPVNRRQVIIGVVVLGGGLAGYEIYKYQKNKKAAQQAAATTASVAGASGYGYGTPAYGYGASGYGYGAGTTYGYGASGGFPAGYYGYGVVTPPGGNPITSSPSTTNAQWDQAAITQLQQDGWDSQTVAGALGAYLNGREVSSSQVNVIDAAIGVEGYPPVPSKTGYPPAIKTGGTTGGGAGGGQGDKAIVPNVRGKHGEQARDEIVNAGLKAAQVPTRTREGKSTVVTSQNPAAGRKVNEGSTVTYHVRVV